MQISSKKILTGFLLGVVVCAVVFWLMLVMVVVDRRYGLPWVDQLATRLGGERIEKTIISRLVEEQSGVAGVVEKVGPSVVTIGISKRTVTPRLWFFGNGGGEEELIEEDIGSGFVVSADGLVVTNRHVVDDREAKYRVITIDNQILEVTKIYRDPINDLAILQVAPDGLTPLELGDSDELRVGQFVVAIGTALGEYRNTVTTGVISGLGRGVTAGSPFAGSVEEADNVIQTDAAINPGNSGGPLLNGVGEVIGVNWAVSASGENIGFAIPINVVQESLDNFNRTGEFNRPFLGVRYQMIDQETAIMNEVPQGAYVIEIVSGSPADKAGLQKRDIITHFDGQRLEGDSNLASLINQKKVGDKVNLKLWREEGAVELEVKLEEFSEN